MMKLSVSTYSLSRWRKEQNKTLEDTIEWIAQSGVKGIEFSGLDEKAQADPIGRATELRERSERAGLKVVSYCVGAELLTPRPRQKETVEATKRQVDVAAALGVPSMRHDVTRGFGDNAKGLRIPKTFEAVLKHIVPAIREITEYGASKGVKTSLENHGFYMQQSTRVEKLIKAVKNPNYGLTIDLGNFLCVNENPVSATKRLAKYAFMAHTKDFHIKEKEKSPGAGWFNTPTKIALRGAIAGHGEVDIPAELKLLKKAGYDGYLSLEFEGMEEPTKAVTLGLEYLRKQLEGMK
jgi:sugar phosphate isomerase/epimerase